MRVYVGNIAYTTTEDQLRQLFAQFGMVSSVNIATDRETDRPKGFAFVDVEGDLDEIIEGLNGTIWNGRALKVSQARERNWRDKPGSHSSSSNRDR